MNLMPSKISIKIQHATDTSPTKLIVCYKGIPIASFKDPMLATDYAESIDVCYAKWIAGWNDGDKPNYDGDCLPKADADWIWGN